ncbi:nucleoside hydrolase [Aquincola sp. S2]|uniref:Nucleoside hydrolase n=1 Tax=Pseudaquabacterium terrae TaxID=2732868 RepID=A0ABX2EMI4_9BURK|nr:nucleoside hydrolase [Aquabacterium terrae]NRF69775.1 nucleoside hydrolase [Aquabacterium terrae]
MSSTSPLPLLIDCDPGIDDALALLLAAGSPALDIRAVTCVAGNRPVEQTSLNARRVLDLAGADAVPVHAGCARPLTQAEPRSNLVHGADGLGGVALPLRGAVAAGHAIDVLVELLLAAAPGTLRLVALGPLTNLACAELRSPGLLRRAAQIDVMGGAAFCPGNVNPHAEFNFYADPLAAQIVLSAGAQLQLFGLDVTEQARMSDDWIASLAALPGPAAAAAQAMLRAYSGVDPLLHDVCPVAAVFAPELFDSAAHRVAVEWRDREREGRLLVDDAAAAAGDSAIARIVTRANTPALLDTVAQALRRLGA